MMPSSSFSLHRRALQHLLRRYATLPASLKWRSELHRRRAAAQVAALLLERSDPIPFLLRAKPALLPSPPSHSLILRILHRTQSRPQTALQFFQWAQSHLGFEPDLRALSKMAQILVLSDLLAPAHQLFDPMLSSQPPAIIITFILDNSSSCIESQLKMLGFLFESYSRLGRVCDALNVFQRIKTLGSAPSIRQCDALLEALCLSSQYRKAWCFYASAMRGGAKPDARTWVLLVRLLCQEGKLERATKLLALGYCSNAAYDLVVDCYSKKGDFRGAVGLLNGMCDNGLKPGFNAYSSVLDGGCRFGDVGIVQSMLREMVVRTLVPMVPFFNYNLVITRLCELERTYAAEMFFVRGRKEKFGLDKGTYTCMLRALANDGRIEDAIRVHHIMLHEGFELKPSCYDVLVSGICKGEPSQKVDLFLKDVIGMGFTPRVSDLSHYISAQCIEGRWKEASDLLNITLEKGILPDASCCCAFVEHFCANGLLDSAMTLHQKMKCLGRCLDVGSYNVLLRALLKERKMEEAIEIFEYMQGRNVVSSASFVLMVRALCHKKELRKAMKLHDEMLKVGLKPDDATYKGLISGFA